MRDHFFLFRLVAEPQAGKSSSLTRRFGWNDQRDLFHLLASRQSPIQIIRAVADLERYFPHWTERAEDDLFTLAKTLLSVCPVAGSAERFAIARSGDRDQFAFIHKAFFLTGARPGDQLDGRDARRSIELFKAGEQTTTALSALRLSYTGVNPAAGFEPATSRLQGEVTVIFTTGRTLSHSAHFFFPFGDALVDRSNFFTIALSFANSHPISSPSQLHLPSLNNIPHRPHRLVASHLDGFVNHEVPLAVDQLETTSTVESDFVNLLSQQALFLPLAGAWPLHEAQEPGCWVNIKAHDLPSSRTRVHFVICADPAIGFDHRLQMVEDVASGYLPHVKALAQFAEHLVPRAAEVAAQKPFEWPKHVGEPLVVVAVLTSASGRYEFWLIVVISIGNESEALAPLAIFASAAVTLTFDHDLVHVRTHY